MVILASTDESAQQKDWIGSLSANRHGQDKFPVFMAVFE
jgi:hypothetical protein